MDSFIARQPVFDSGRNVFGYELLFRSGPNNCFTGLDGDAATNKVVTDAMSVHGLESLTSGRKIFVNVTRNVLFDGAVMILPPEQTVVEILETVEIDDDVIEACRSLRMAGYTVALDDFIFDTKFDRLLKEIDILKVDFMDSTAEARKAFAERGMSRGLKLLAEKVESYEEFQEAINLGYHFFQGYFFCKPQLISAKDVPASKLSALRFLEQMSRPMLDIDQVEEIIRQDVGLSYKLLKYLNSAAFGLRHRVTSIRHAMTLLGDRAVRKWASLIALANIGEDKPSELFTNSLFRARFCELVGAGLGQKDKLDQYFSLGMFSVLDALVDRPMADLLNGLNLGEPVKQALLGKATPMLPVLDLVLALERGRWSRVAQVCQELQLDERNVAGMFRDSVAWAEAICHGQTTKDAKLAS